MAWPKPRPAHERVLERVIKPDGEQGCWQFMVYATPAAMDLWGPMDGKHALTALCTRR